MYHQLYLCHHYLSQKILLNFVNLIFFTLLFVYRYMDLFLFGICAVPLSPLFFCFQTSETRRTERDGQGNVTTTVTTGPDDKPSPGSTEPRSMEPWGMHPWRPGQHWPFTRRCPGQDRLEGERDRTDDVPHIWRPGMSWPGSRRYPGPGRQEGDENDDSIYKKFFGSWFKS